MTEIEINETVYLISIIFSIISGILIILLLAVQSFVLVKLMPLIRTTAHNSSLFTEAMNPIKKIIGIKKPYPQELLRLDIKHCQHYNEISHVHTSDCV